MATRVDNQGYLLDSRGNRLDGAHGNDNASVQARWNLILEEWKKNHPKEATGPRDGTVIMEVEQGDCQWTIAEGAGADPTRTYQQLNAQFSNPDLIHKGDIVFVDQPTRLAKNRDGEDNVDLFRDSISGRSNHAVNWESGDEGPAGPEQWQSIEKDIDSYLDSIGNDPTIAGSLFAPGNDFAWGTENGCGREILLERYLAKLPDNKQRMEAAQAIVDAPDADADLKRQLGEALESYGLSLPQPTGSSDTLVGPRITTYVPDGAGGDNSELFKDQFQQYASDTSAGLFYDMEGNTYSNGAYAPGGFVDIGNGTSIDLTENAWLHLETVTQQYLGTTPEPQRYDIVQSLLSDPEATSRSREAAASAYLQTFPKEKRQAEVNRLSEGASAEVKKDIQAAFDRVQAEA